MGRVQKGGQFFMMEKLNVVASTGKPVNAVCRGWGSSLQAAVINCFVAIISVVLVTLPVSAEAAGPSISSVSPNSGSVDGGETVTINGNGLSGTRSVKIGGKEASGIVVVDDQTITAITPETVVGNHDVVVTTAGIQASLPAGFETTSFVSAPILTSISPSTGPVSGGTTVTISGYGFSNATGVSFGGVAARSFQILSDGHVSAVTPNGSLGLVDVEMTSSIGSSAALTQSFTYIPASTNSDLSSLTLSQGALAPSFSANVTAYSAEVSESTASIAISATALENDALVTVNGQPSTSSVNLQPGANTITIVVTAQDGVTTKKYTLTVTRKSPAGVSVADQTINVPAGTSPPDVRLDRNASGGPFTNAAVISVQPVNAGRAVVTMGDYAQLGSASPVGWYLKFIPAPTYSGTVVVDFSLTSAAGSNAGRITYNLGYDPAVVANEMDSLVHGFIESRQNLIATMIKVPGLLERRRMDLSSSPVTTRLVPSQQGMSLGFSTSLSQMNAARDGQQADALPFNIWMDGALMLHNRSENDDRWGSFGMVSAGVDYLVSDTALVGVSFHFDRMTDPTRENAELTGNGWLAGPYASLELGKGIFWDTSILYGGSANDLETAFWDGSFNTKRWLFDTSIKGQYYLDGVTTLTPKARAVYFSEKVEDYIVRNGSGSELAVEGFTSEQLRLSLGAEIAREYRLSDGSQMTPKIGVTGGFSGLDGAGAFASLNTGVVLETAEQWAIDFSILYSLDGDGGKSAGARAALGKRF